MAIDSVICVGSRSARFPRLMQAAGMLALVCCTVSPVHAQSADTAELLRQLEALRARQAQIAQMQIETDATLRALEKQLGMAAPAVAATPVVASASPVQATEWKLKVSGDLRLRVQGDYSDNSKPARNSSQLRARFGATYRINDRLSIGGRVVTGDSGDPNSSDVQLSNWDDDLGIALDLAYMQWDFGNLKLAGGKIPQPFVRTDLVWDADVNPQGAAASYRRAFGDGSAIRANASFFTIDVRATGQDSYMSGLQVGYDSRAHGRLRYDLSAAYYDYTLHSMVGADGGDWRSNRLARNGSYLSGYRLVDLIAGVSWQGRNPKWPVRLVADYVRNLGAVDNQNRGFSLDLGVGRASQPSDWRVSYGYAQTDVDAVLAAFSHDNIGIATNYKMHSLTLDFTPARKTQIGAIWYRYKYNNPMLAGSNATNDWLDRFRLFYLVNF